ncbi:hypothetical protein [Phenylobacterium sp.]|uniref:hypothetical protein n=1 Tax=Phenylobacterium sp. TaxID=1871053 RepID=UPI0035AF61C2
MATGLKRRLAQGGFVVMSIADAVLFGLRYDGSLLLTMLFNIYGLYASVAYPVIYKSFFVGAGVMQLLLAVLMALDDPPRPREQVIAFAALCLCHMVIMLLQPKAAPAAPSEPSEPH